MSFLPNGLGALDDWRGGGRGVSKTVDVEDEGVGLKRVITNARGHKIVFRGGGATIKFVPQWGNVVDPALLLHGQSKEFHL